MKKGDTKQNSESVSFTWKASAISCNAHAYNGNVRYSRFVYVLTVVYCVFCFCNCI